MFARALGVFEKPVAVVCVAVASLIPTASLAAHHHAEAYARSQAPAITFSIGRRSSPVSTSIHLRDFSRIHETMKPLEIATPTPKPEPTFPSFANPLHRHRMAMIAF